MMTPFPAPRRAGFALVAVLSAIIILVALFVVTLTRLQGQVMRLAAESSLIALQSLNQSALTFVLAAHQAADFDPSLPLELVLGGTNYSLRLQDAGGLIDVNTANSRLIEALLVRLELSDGALERWRAFRRDGARFLSLGHFVQVVGGRRDLLDTLPGLATVFSGRTGVAPESAPSEVIAILREIAGPRDLPLELVSPPSGKTFVVLIETDSGRRLAGTVFLGPDMAAGRVLELN